MSARDLIEEAARRYPGVPDAIAERAINNLEAAGYRIVGPDEVDPVTVERCVTEMEANWGHVCTPELRDAIRAIASGGKQ